MHCLTRQCVFNCLEEGNCWRSRIIACICKNHRENSTPAALEMDSDEKILNESTRGLLSGDMAADLANDFDLEDALNELDNGIGHTHGDDDDGVSNPLQSPDSPQGTNQNHSSESKHAAILGNNVPVAITRPPTTSRDTSYAVAFWMHFLVIILLSLFEGDALEESLIVYGKAGSWASHFMIVTILGAFCGCSMIFVLANSQRRDDILSVAIPLSIALQIIFGSILFALKTRYSFLGILVFIGVLIDSFKYTRAKESITFASAVLNIVIKILNQYGMSMVTTCISLVMVQTLIILWWGSFFVGLISSVHQAYADILVVIMLFSLYWVQQVFQALISYVIGGCTLWYFLKRDGQAFKPQERVLLHLQCGLSVGFGSVCKGALYSNFAMNILELHDWSKRTSKEGTGCGGLFGVNSVILLARHIVSRIVAPFLSSARKFHRLAFCVAATYGRTFSRSAADHAANYEETLDIAIEDTTTHVLAAVAKVIPCALAMSFGLIVEENPNEDAGRSWCLFFLVCYLLSYCGVSLALSMYRSAVDAIIVAFGETPEKLAKENQIIFSRFLRLLENSDF